MCNNHDNSNEATGACTGSSVPPTISRYFMREYDKENDEMAESRIPRLQFSYSSDGMLAVSSPKDLTIRPNLSKQSKMMVVCDSQKSKEDQVVGGYGCNIKQMMVNQCVQSVYYSFDFHVHPDYRNQSLSKMLMKNALDLMVGDNSSCCLISSSKSNTAINRTISGQIDSFLYFDQRQSAWSCKESAEPLPAIASSQYEVKYSKLDKDSNLKNIWNNAFKNYNFTPANFDDIIVDNSKFLETVYYAKLMINDRVIATASISIWNQDEIFCLRDGLSPNANKLKHRQLFSCFSQGGSPNENELLFSHLLRHVDNDQRENGVHYLFVGYDIKDPLANLYRLKKGIKNLEFTATVGCLSSADKERAVRSIMISSNEPSIMWNDPRDYGILMLYKEEEVVKPVIPIISRSPRQLLEPAIRSPRGSPKAKSNTSLSLAGLSPRPSLSNVSPRTLAPTPTLNLAPISPRNVANSVSSQTLSPRNNTVSVC